MTQDAPGDAWGSTESALRSAMRTLRGADATAAVATVAGVDGSAYRRPGAKLVVPVDGAARGAVTAGCLEPRAADIGETVAASGEPRLVTFDLSGDESGGWGLGLGCHGVVDLFVEPLDASWDPVLDAVGGGESVVVVTVVEATGEAPVGSRSLVVDGERAAVPDRPAVPAPALARAADAVAAVAGTSGTRTVDVPGTGTLLVDGLEPTPELLAFGSRADVAPVVDLAGRTGFRTTVYSPRAGVDAGTFPAADAVTAGRPTDVADAVDAAPHTFAVLLSHDLVDDALALGTLLTETAVPYVGVMGPRKRFDAVRGVLDDEGVDVGEADLERVATPVGLDLGGDTPAEIALSVVSEVQAVRNGREGGRLRAREGPIHPRE